jgi:hypothetical protein
MCRTAAALVLLSLPAGLLAADEPAPNTLTAKEAAEGWISLFDGETTFGWRPVGESRWSVARGMLAPQGKERVTLVSTTSFSEFELRMQYQVRPGSSSRLLFGVGPAGQTDGRTVYSVPLPESDPGWKDYSLVVSGDRVTESTRAADLFGDFSGSSREWKRSDPPPRGHLALFGTGVVFRNIKLKPLGAKPLFNGKDLAGWKKYEGEPGRAKSQFAVTGDGLLSLKDGPGDLQTEGQWADFVLQLDCRTNGPRLNSGVFFRCLPGQYQQGYEAQIHNNFSADPPKEYAVEEYDPDTHDLKGKTKVKSPAVDWGTGGIYRRVPARSAAAKDGEWFTMTVVTHGRHIATWVNGIQQVDWTDNRPPHENPRNGCRVEKGAISLQGHDPTTDLNFRHIRLAELPAAK